MSASTCEQLVADRAKLRHLLQQHPDWSWARFAQETARSLSWVKTWQKRFKQTASDDESILWGKPPIPHKHPAPPHPLVLERLLELRNHPPEELKRTPGPRALAYYLANDPILKEQGITPPRSTSTIYKLLVRLGCYTRPGLKPPPTPDSATPLEIIAIDFKDASSVEVEPDGKKQHTVEVLNLIDEGTSVLWEAVARDDFNAETVIETLLEVFERQGLPHQLRFDRDPRFVGSASGRDFPAALVRMLYVLGVQPAICPAHQPWKNGFVERYNRSFKYECLLIHQPENLGRVREVTAQYKEHYNYQRPHQAKSCHNQPPRLAFPELPALPHLPLMVDPDSWLVAIDGEHFSRKVKSDGSIMLDKYTYYIGHQLAGKQVVLVVEAAKRELKVLFEKKELKRLGLKGLYRRAMYLEEYRQVIAEEARSERRGWRPNTERSIGGNGSAPPLLNQFKAESESQTCSTKEEGEGEAPKVRP